MTRRSESGIGSELPRSGWVLATAHAAVVTGLLSTALPRFPGIIPVTFLAGAVLLYLVDVTGYWTHHRRRAPDGLLLLTAASHLGLALAAGTAIVAGLTGRDLWPGVVAAAIFGWYLLAILGFVQKILLAGILAGIPSLVRAGAGLLGTAVLLFHGAYGRMWRMVRQ